MGPPSGRELDAVFSALSDPTRRSMIERLVDGGPASATSMARSLPISRQAVVKHLRTLDDAGLVRPERVGREVRYSATPAVLADASGWMASVGAAWDRRINRLRDLRGR